MKTGEGKDRVVILDRYTLKEVARFDSTPIASKELGIKATTIRRAIASHCAAYDCYWVYERELPNWTPKRVCFIRANGVKQSPKLQELLNQI